MPVYVYRCPRCGHCKELERPVGEREEPVLCRVNHIYEPEEMELVIQPAELHFKGEGWTPRHHG